jgi:hypothetical protein
MAPVSRRVVLTGRARQARGKAQAARSQARQARGRVAGVAAAAGATWDRSGVALGAAVRAVKDAREAQQERELSLLLLRTTGRRALIRRCAWCERFAVGPEWMHLVERHGQRLSSSLRNRATHGICPECFDGQMAITHAHHGTAAAEEPPACARVRD